MTALLILNGLDFVEICIFVHIRNTLAHLGL